MSTTTTDNRHGRALGLLDWVLWHRYRPAAGRNTVTITLPAETVQAIQRLVGHDGQDLWPGDTHREPCGCVHEIVDAPDDQWIGQAWRSVIVCVEHTDGEVAGDE